MRAYLLAFSALSCLARGDRWAVIAAGSKGYFNYRHQADACHAYQIMRRSGIPESNIILMMQDDVANSTSNPFKGQLFNQPGENPPDVYADCKVDYKGDIVTAKLFMDVLTGSGSGKVLRSGPEDTVFINFVDHGGVGIVAFPNGPVLTVKQLSETLQKMQSKKLFRKLLFYMEACESGSMFPNLTADGGILAVTAANAHESSWGTYCMQEAVVRGKNLRTCLGDLFSVNWMQDSDEENLGSETIATQVARVKKLTNKSHVMIFGDRSFENDTIGRFELNARYSPATPPSRVVDVREMYVRHAIWAWETAAPESPAKAAAWRIMRQVLADRAADEELFTRFAAKACEGASLTACRSRLLEGRSDLENYDCHDELVRAFGSSCSPSEFHQSGSGWNGFNMKFAQVLVNACDGRGLLGKSTKQLVNIIEDQCRSQQAVTVVV